MPVLSGVGRGTSSISLHAEAALGQEPAIFLGGGEEPRRDQRRIAAAGRADRAHRRGDGRDIAVAAQLAHEAAARTKRAGHAGDHQMGLPHPMERGIGEHRVELGDEIERVAVDLADIEPLHARHGEQLVAQIDAEDIARRAP